MNNDCNGDDDEGDCDSDLSKVMVMIIIADCGDLLIDYYMYNYDEHTIALAAAARGGRSSSSS